MFNYDPFFTAPMAEFLLRFFGGGLLHPFDTRPFVEDDIQSLAVDVFENNGRMVVDASLPSEKSGDLDTTIPANKLTIKTDAKQKREEEQGKYHYRERSYGAWQRDVILPKQVEKTKLKPNT